MLAEKLGITPEEASLALGASLPPVSLSSYDDEENDDLDTMRLDDLGFDDMNLDDDDQ